MRVCGCVCVCTRVCVCVPEGGDAYHGPGVGHVELHHVPAPPQTLSSMAGDDNVADLTDWSNGLVKRTGQTDWSTGWSMSQHRLAGNPKSTKQVSIKSDRALD